MRIPATFVAFAILVVSASASAGDGTAPRSIVDKVTSEVTRVLKETARPADEKRKEIRQVVESYVDFEVMSKLVLARNWSKLSESEQLDFVEAFKDHLSLTYGQNVDTYRNEKVSITGDRKEARGDWTVATRIVRGGKNDILVDYRLRKLGSDWRIIDVIIERVSLVSNFRSQFQSILANGGPKRLLEVLREKNAAGKSLKS